MRRSINHLYDDAIGEKIIYNGRPVIFEGYESDYEGDFWLVQEEENGRVCTVAVATFIEEAWKIRTQIENIIKEKQKQK